MQFAKFTPNNYYRAQIILTGIPADITEKAALPKSNNSGSSSFNLPRLIKT